MQRTTTLTTETGPSDENCVFGFLRTGINPAKSPLKFHIKRDIFLLKK